MDDFLGLIGQLLLITCVQMFAEMFIDADKRPYLTKITSVACYACGVYIVIQYVFQNMMPEVISVFRSAF